MYRKWIRMVMVMLAALAMVISAGAESILTDYYDAGCRLLFNTDNVTLTGNAVFSLDGVWFKTADGTYVQAGEDSYQRLHLLTPFSDGSERETGYTVIANGSRIYAMEDYNPLFYREGSSDRNCSVIAPSVYLNSLMSLGRAAADLMNQIMADHLTVSSLENGGSGLEIRLEKGESPALLNGIVTMVGEYLTEAYFGIDYRYYRVQEQTNGSDYTIEDWNGLFEHFYEEEYGEKIPENFYEILWGMEDKDQETRTLYMGQYEVISQRIDDLINDVLAGHETGWISIRPDGTIQVYENQDAYIIANGQQLVLYENFMVTVMHRWEKEYGEKLSDEEMDRILSGEDEEKLERYIAITDAMEEEYRRMAVEDGKASAIWVRADGSAEMIYDLQGWYDRERLLYNYTTVTEGIVYCMRSLAVDEAKLRAETDAQGRLANIQGTLVLQLTDDREQEHSLDISFRFNAGSYGESKVEIFDPEAYNVVPWPRE